jgi:GPH family glycoside/pentoside/hexuronide:cation symporter
MEPLKQALSSFMMVMSKERSVMEKQMKLSKSFLWRQRIGYGAADFACNLVWQMISLYLLYYYTDIAKLSGVAIAFMFIVCRIIDGITDLLIGYAIDKTHTRWGKSRPYFLWGAIPFAIFAYLAFSVPVQFSQGAKLAWAYMSYIGLSFMYTVVNIPMASILPALTDDAQERTNLAVTRQFFAFIGASVVSAFALKMVDALGHHNQAIGFKWVMLIFGVVSSLIFFFTFFSVREINQVQVSKKSSLKEALKSLLHNQPWKIFALNIIVMFTGYFLQTSALVYYYSAVLGSKQLSVNVATMMSVIPVIANVFVPFIAKKMKKRQLFVASSIGQGIGMVVIWLAGHQIGLIYAGAAICGLAYGVRMSIYFSMQADPVDYGIWKTGVDTAGSLSAINGFLGKVAQALAGGISGFLISYGGYQAGTHVQSASAILAIKAMYLYIPMLSIIGSVIIMSFYKLDDQYPQIIKELNERKKVQIHE